MDAALTSLSAGLLPKWLLFISLVALGNSIQSYISLTGTQNVYLGPSPVPKPIKSTLKPTPSSALANSPVTPLSARTFGTWTFISALVRLQCALSIGDAVAYRLCFATFGVAAGHFGMEWLLFGTARWGRGLVGPVVVSTVSLVWMWMQWEGYVVQDAGWRGRLGI